MNGSHPQPNQYFNAGKTISSDNCTTCLQTVGQCNCSNRGNATYVIQAAPSFTQPSIIPAIKPSIEHGKVQTSYILKESNRIEAGNGVSFSLLTDGIRIENTGILETNVYAVAGSGLIITQDSQNPKKPSFKISLNPQDIVNQAGFVSTITIDGVAYSPASGNVSLSSGIFSTGIKQIQSITNTIAVNSTLGVGVIGLETRPIKINGSTIQPSGDGTPIEFLNGTNTTLSVSGNQIRINAVTAGGITSISQNGQTYTPNNQGNISLPTTSSSSSIERLYYWELTIVAADLLASNIDILNTTTHVITSSASGVPIQLENTQALVVHKDGVLVSPANYTFTGSTLGLNQSLTPIQVGTKLQFVHARA
jgi:hypothetical protein